MGDSVITYLYLIKHPHIKNCWKIGVTNDFIRRLKDYNSSEPYDTFSYSFLSVIPEDKKWEIEYQLKIHANSKEEWFVNTYTSHIKGIFTKAFPSKYWNAHIKPIFNPLALGPNGTSPKYIKSKN